MREIKFRAWDKDNEEMIFQDGDIYSFRLDGDGLTVGCVGFQHVNEGGNYVERKIWEVPEQVVMQFTGLQDKNGKDIFEGDLVRCGGDMVLGIGFEDGAFLARYDGGRAELYRDFDPKKCEVIGNIYENQELLK